MRCLTASAVAMSTPASAYFMEKGSMSVSGPGVRSSGRSLLEDNWLPRVGAVLYSECHYLLRTKTCETSVSNAQGRDAERRSRKPENARASDRAPRHPARRPATYRS